MLERVKSLAMPAVVAVMLSSTAAIPQGVPTIDTRNLLQQLQIYEQLLTDAGLQTDQLEQLFEQVRVLEEQLSQLQEIQALLSDPTQVLSMAMGIDLDGILNGDFDLEMVSTILRGARGDWSGLTREDSERFQSAITRALEGGGTSQEQIAALTNSENRMAQRNGVATASSAATSAAAEVAYEEAAQSVRRVQLLVEEIPELESLKASVDHNTRVTAELAIALAAMWQLESVQTMNVGLAGVIDAATLAEIEQFNDFTPVEFQ